MPTLNNAKPDAESAANIVRDAGGQVVGKTRLQKMAYLLELTGLGSGFSFEYRHYGPYSEDLANMIVMAHLLELVVAEERTANWGGHYSTFKTSSVSPNTNVDTARKRILELGIEANPIALELAATAAYLAKEGNTDAWAETQRRKPEKAEKFLDAARALYSELQSVQTPVPLPTIH